MTDARSFKIVTDADKKTDKLDAEKLGRYLRLWKMREAKLSMPYVPTREECELRAYADAERDYKKYLNTTSS